jgi:hypothetical protein
VNRPPQSAGAAGDGLLDGLRRLAPPGAVYTDIQLITDAYGVAAYWHQGQLRRSGDPYITHPVAVAAILAEMGADVPTMCAGLLHDVAADTPYTLAALRGRFGAEIAGLVGAAMTLDGLSADQVAAASATSAAAAALAPDERALLIKLADRLHNMRTLRHLPRAKQVRKSRQTLEAMAPLAGVLGMDVVRSELEDLASAALRRHSMRPRTVSGHLLAATAVMLPASARQRWRHEWLGEVSVLSTRRERIVFAGHVLLGIGRLAVTLYQPTAGFRRACKAILATAITASTLDIAGWKIAAFIAAGIIPGTVLLLWILNSDARTSRLANLIHVLRDTPGKAARTPSRAAAQGAAPACATKSSTRQRQSRRHET